ncbi:MAG: hypothetical protein Q4A65_04035 [Bacillota bacterium]|nr:hypothetical protein [Bacillota bacterium]
MSTSIENLRRLAERDIKDHTAIFDLYVTVGRNIDYLSIKFGIDPEDLINLLEGYGEKIRVSSGKTAAPKAAADGKKSHRLSGFMIGGTGAEVDPEFGMVLDYSGKGRFKNLPRVLIEEYVRQFYPGIASENPENDWICLDKYLEIKHPGWRNG